MNRMMFRNALAFTLALVACNSIAASFDCSKAANFAESSICNDGYLSGVDSILARSYQKALAETEHPDELRQSQREWLSVRDQCTTQKCLDQTLGARVTFLDSYSRVEKSKAYAAEEKLRKDEYEAQRQAEDLANSQRDQQYRIAQEQFRQQKQQSAQPHQVAQTQSQSVQPAPSSQSPANVVSAQQVRPAQPVAGKPAVLRMWQAFWAGPTWKYTLLIGSLITCLAIWRHHTEAATIYTDYTDAAITNALPAIGAVAALILRWLEMPGLVSGIALGTGIILAIAYAVFATFRTNQGALSITLVIVAKLTLITVFYALIGMLIASLFSNSARRKGESQARAAARNSREKKQTMALITGLSVAYTAFTAWVCRRPEFTSLSECLEFDTAPA
ncbi:lipoprotein [Pseudomonas fluorescens]|jgi:uncharacterized protein|uniref:Lipoprotein n=2 Tax=Pseudomonas TaxID=286 RepID=A0A379IJH6_PSEFL|nr:MULTISPECIES: lysozyme inhibitor LprI family protein [Pseudomonas]ETK25206.1 hypothetical protein H096_01995 [Pseudomonas sp. FH1]MBJ2180109.1 hypothetical protein [Pseudomonas veronii]MCR4538560.1 hypothetical protein [Pseudomonas sp. 18.1.10]MDI3187522.1 hypothetical protein [Pseudomonas paracarnis]SUD33530.1 lipoprotein [Pseudomonas fluorescens]